MGWRDGVRELWRELPEFSGLLDLMRRGLPEIALEGIPTPAAVSLAVAAAVDLGRPLVLLSPDWSTAEQVRQHAETWAEARVGLFPPREFLPYAIVAQSPEIYAERLEVLGGKVPMISLPVSSLRRQLPAPEVFAAGSIDLEVGAQLLPSDLARAAVAAGYERQTLVEGPGTFAVRGGIVDIFPVVGTHPIRIEFCEDRVESLRPFSVETQRSMDAVQRLRILPAHETVVPEGTALREALERIRSALRASAQRLTGEPEARDRLQALVGSDLEDLEAGTAPGRWESYLPFLGPSHSVLAYLTMGGRRPLCVVLDAQITAETVAELSRHDQERFSGFLMEGRMLPEQVEAFAIPHNWQEDLAGATILYVDALGSSRSGATEQVSINARPVTNFSGQWTLAKEDLGRWQRAGYRVVCCVGTPERSRGVAEQLRDGSIQAVLDQEGVVPLAPHQVNVCVGELPAGFEVPSLRLAVVGEHELFGRRARRGRPARTAGAGMALQSYEDLSVGDYVVHSSHGIGQYLGTTTMSVQGKSRDYLVLRYDGTDRLYVPTDQIALVQKYVGQDDAVRVSRLGGTEWAKAKQRVRESVRRMAEELLNLYAARQTVSGHAFPPDTPWQLEFEEAFPYEPTADQLQAIAEIKADMERPVPMDRLLCGDVGYGKTEVVMRAAFKAAMDSKQVAVLVPTTILAEQHFLTFTERFAQTPVRIGMLSRFRNRKEQEETITALRRGTIDIVIGTHRLLQDDIDFKNLGMLVIDEEHRFGVVHKERLKQLRNTVDVLSLTATPIPRTLHMAMAGIRDMSVITTPPENRYPVETMVVDWSPALVREAITRELARGGQVYYLHNRVRSIGRAYERLVQLCPDADIVVGHGQMGEDDLERIMTAFWRGEHQVLLSTTIIESGLDIPNANTIIVEDADQLGLAQLYQIRGRVGRSSRVAFAYFSYRRERHMSELATKRLEAIRQFTELGSGFKIALRDLELRGAGNLLGPEQHGFVAAVGFGLYAQLLEEAVREARGEREAPKTKTTVDLLVDAYVDNAYIVDARAVLDLYKKTHAASSEEDIQEIVAELRDRFGPVPTSVQNLLRMALIRVRGERLGLLAIVQQGRSVRLLFPNYAGPNRMDLAGLPATLRRRLRVETRPKPLVELALDGTDDISVLGAVENCLDALLHHPRPTEHGADSEAETLAPPTPAERSPRVPTPYPAGAAIPPTAVVERAPRTASTGQRVAMRAAQPPQFALPAFRSARRPGK